MKIMCMDVILRHIRRWERLILPLNLCILKISHFQTITKECRQRFCRNLRNQIDEIEKEIENVQKQMKDFLSVKAKKIRGARYKVRRIIQ